MQHQTLSGPLLAGRPGDPLTQATVSTDSYPYDPIHDRYQRYYREGLRADLVRTRGIFREHSRAWFPSLLRFLLRARNSYRFGRTFGRLAPSLGSGLDRFAQLCGAWRQPPHPTTGVYDYTDSAGLTVRFCIDSQDSGVLGSPDLLRDCRVYFKTNYWTDHNYDPRVIPFYNANPLILPHLAHLRAARAFLPTYDLCFVVRVWGGTDEVEGVEHCIRLLEAASRVPGNNYLFAYLVAGDIPSTEKRLRAAGVHCSTKPLPLRELWDVSARSRVNLIRLGMHACVPWRMCDLLAMGACPVLDQRPKTLWPAPLCLGKHYWSLDAETSLARPVAADDAYRAIPELLGGVIADAVRTAETRRATADYFDRYLAPESVGRQIRETTGRAVDGSAPAGSG